MMKFQHFPDSDQNSRSSPRKFPLLDMTVTFVDINQKICLDRVLEIQLQIVPICTTIDQIILEIQIYGLSSEHFEINKNGSLTYKNKNFKKVISFFLSTFAVFSKKNDVLQNEDDKWEYCIDFSTDYCTEADQAIPELKAIINDKNLY